MELKKSTYIWHSWRIWLSPLVISLLVLQASSGHAQGIRKIVDDKGVTFFTNEPPENDPLPKAVAPAPAAPVSAPSGPLTASLTQPVTSAPKSAQSAASAPAKLPINPAKALGDWPPKSFKGLPAKADN